MLRSSFSVRLSILQGITRIIFTSNAVCRDCNEWSHFAEVYYRRRCGANETGGLWLVGAGGITRLVGDTVDRERWVFVVTIADVPQSELLFRCNAVGCNWSISCGVVQGRPCRLRIVIESSVSVRNSVESCVDESAFAVFLVKTPLALYSRCSSSDSTGKLPR